MEHHVERLQNALNEARAALSLPPIQKMQSIDGNDEVNSCNIEPGEEGFDSPDGLVSAPIRSLYEVTRLQQIQAGEKAQPSGAVIRPDFIAQGVISIEKAEKLTEYYLNRLDHFFYDFLGNYTSLAHIRDASSLLTLMLCTVASLHDPLESDVYDRLSRELRDLASSFMFQERLGLEDIKAFCMGAYWLSDMTSNLSALAFHKATSMQFHVSHLNQPDTDREGFDRSQMWLMIYLHNEQISILRGLPSSGMGRDFVKWENHVESPHSGEIDLRMASHIDLLLILNRVRELYGLDTSKSIPSILIQQLQDFNVQIDRWGAGWSGRLATNKWLGNFPSEAVQLHWRVAKFYVCSHVFRGLDVSTSIATTFSHNSEDIATCAITTATSILQLLTESEVLRSALIGMPHWFHTMFAFAAVFLLKMASTYRQHVNINVELVLGTCKKVLEIFRQSPCARQHLVHRIARGLSEMIERSEMKISLPGHGNGIETARNGMQDHLQYGQVMGPLDFDVNNRGYDVRPLLDLENFDFLSMPPLGWSMDFAT